jgi:hypothetical protein
MIFVVVADVSLMGNVILTAVMKFTSVVIFKMGLISWS